MGRIWRMDLADGRRYALKELFYEWEESAAVREFDFVQRSGVRAPRFVRTVDGNLAERLPSELGGVQVRLFSWVNGRAPRHDDPGRARWFGATLGRLHTLRLSPHGWSADAWYDTCPPPSRWADLIDRLRAAEVFWAADLIERLLPRLAEVAALVTPNDPRALAVCHRDFCPQNVLTDGTGFTLLDWENAGLAVPARELAAGLVDWHVHGGRIDGDGVRETMRAYRAAGGNATLESPSDFGTHAAGYLNFLEVLVSQRVEADQSSTTVVDADERLRAFLADPPSVAVAERLLPLAR